MPDEPIVKNSKFVKVISKMDEEAEYDQNNFDSEEDFIQQEFDKDVFNQNVFNIKMDLMNFIEDKSLPIAEFLTLKKLKSFIKKEILY
jgi:hypothetical protein